MKISNNKLVENWKDTHFSETDDLHFKFLSNLQNNKVCYSTNKGFESNLQRIDRLVSEDIDFLKTYLEYPEKEDFSYNSYNVMKAKNTLLPFHVRYTIQGKAINFRYSTSVYGENSIENNTKNNISFVFRDFLDISSKINKGNQIHYMIFATQNERYIIDYEKVRFLAHSKLLDYKDLGKNDVLFSLRELLSKNCVNEIFILTRIKEDKLINFISKKSGESRTKYISEYITTSYKTINEEKEVHKYMGNLAVKIYEIKATGKTMNETIIARIKNEKFSTIKKDGETILYESMQAAHKYFDTFMKKDGYDFTYRGVVSQVSKFTKAFETFKQTKKLPRVLPLLRIDLTLDFFVVEKEIYSDPEFNTFIDEMLRKKKAQRELRDKHSKTKSTLTIEENKEEKAI